MSASILTILWAFRRSFERCIPAFTRDASAQYFIRILEEFTAFSLLGWQALIQEDRLISRLAAMESQLNVQGKLWQTASGKDGGPLLDENVKQVVFFSLLHLCWLLMSGLWHVALN